MSKFLFSWIVFGLMVVMLSGCSMRFDCPTRTVHTVKKCDRYISVPAWYGSYCDSCDSCNSCSCY